MVFNVGHGRAITISELAAKVVDLAGSSLPIEHVPYEEVYGEGFEYVRRRGPTSARSAKGSATSPGTTSTTSCRT